MSNVMKSANYYNFKSGKLEISEKTLLDHLDGITVSGAELISEFDHGIRVYWSYVEIVYTLNPHGAIPTSRERANYIRYEFSPFDDTGRKNIRMNPKNDEHPALEKVKELRDSMNDED